MLWYNVASEVLTSLLGTRRYRLATDNGGVYILRIVICDDNQRCLGSISEILEKLIDKNGLDADIALQTETPKEVERYLNTKTANIFFLDIDLHSKETGYQLAEKIRQTDISAYIVFITGHFEYVLQAFKVQPFDFLTKPVTEEVLEQCLLRIYNNHLMLSIQDGDNRDKYIKIKSGFNTYKIKARDIVFIERIKPKTLIYTISGSIACHLTLEGIEEMLNDDNFIRCHKSFIANRAFIAKIDSKNRRIVFDNGQTCDMGRKYKEMVHI